MYTVRLIFIRRMSLIQDAFQLTYRELNSLGKCVGLTALWNHQSGV